MGDVLFYMQMDYFSLRVAFLSETLHLANQCKWRIHYTFSSLPLENASEFRLHSSLHLPQAALRHSAFSNPSNLIKQIIKIEKSC